MYLGGSTDLSFEGSGDSSSLSLEDNKASGSGGAICMSTSSVTVSDSLLSVVGDTATVNGGGIYASGSTLQLNRLLTSSSFSGNVATSGGGAIYASSGSLLTFVNTFPTTFDSNSAISGSGGGLFIQDS
jgi:predicted outer membrane repeat protein